MAVAIEEGVHSTVDFFWGVARPTISDALAGALAPSIFAITAINPLSGAIFGAMMGLSFGVIYSTGQRVIKHFVPEGIPQYVWLALAYVVSVVVGSFFAALFVTGLGVAVMTPATVAIFAAQLLLTVALVNIVWWIVSQAGKALFNCSRS